MVLSDWNGSYGYQNTDDFVRNGNDIMLGFNQHKSNAITDTDAPTLVLALRQAAKNILYTTGNSGYYTHQTGNSGPDAMTTMFIAIDAAVGIAVLGIGAFVFLRWRKKNQH